jgi:hypothetical protein
MLRTFVKSVLCLLVGSILIASPLPANAKQQSWRDAVGDTNNTGLMDIGQVTVTNTRSKISANFRIPKADRLHPFGSTELWLDTDAKKTGPEFLYVVGLPGESAFFAVKKWKVTKSWFDVSGEKRCGKAVRTRFDLDKGIVGFTITPKKGCLGSPKKVRVYVHTKVTAEYGSDDYSDLTDYPHSESDFYPAKKKFSAWVRR